MADRVTFFGLVACQVAQAQSARVGRVALAAARARTENVFMASPVIGVANASMRCADVQPLYGRWGVATIKPLLRCRFPADRGERVRGRWRYLEWLTGPGPCALPKIN